MSRSYQIFLLLFLLGAMSCRKVEYNTVPNPAYLRVFNSLNYPTTLANKDNPPPFLTMIIDPQFDKSGAVIGGAILGDFLDERLNYAPPYPSNAGSTDTVNNEYPGNEKVLVGPVLNGFDLSSWAQVPSGNHRIQFYNRTKNTTPFFQLPASSRKNLLADTTVSWSEGEVYTMEVLQRDIFSTVNFAFIYMRNEKFTKIGWADSLSYVNFYNLSAIGYAAAYNDVSPGSPGDGSQGANEGKVILDTMNIYYTLHSPDSTDPNGVGRGVIPGYQNIPLTGLSRSFSTGIAPYYGIPVFAGKDATGGVYSHIWQELTFLSPAYSPANNPFQGGIFGSVYGNYGMVYCTEAYPNSVGYANTVPNLNILTPSGKNSEQSFSAISSLEWINNKVYLMTVQRQYPAPINN